MLAIAWLPAAIAGAASLGGSLLGRKSQQSTNRTNVMLAREANESRRELAEFAFNKDVEMWEMQRDYNRPEAQMERLKAAGLNPHLVYGSGTVTGNMAGTPPSYQTPAVGTPQVGVPQAPDLGGAVDSFLGAQMNIKQMEGIDLANLQKDWLADTARAESILKDWEVEKTALLRGKAIQNPRETAEALWDNFISNLSASEKQNLATDLKNQYQKQLNKWIKVGMTPGDSWKLRMGTMMLQKLGIDVLQFEDQIEKLKPNE